MMIDFGDDPFYFWPVNNLECQFDVTDANTPIFIINTGK